MFEMLGLFGHKYLHTRRHIKMAQLRRPRAAPSTILSFTDFNKMINRIYANAAIPMVIIEPMQNWIMLILYLAALRIYQSIVLCFELNPKLL